MIAVAFLTVSSREFILFSLYYLGIYLSTPAQAFTHRTTNIIIEYCWVCDEKPSEYQLKQVRCGVSEPHLQILSVV